MRPVRSPRTLPRLAAVLLLLLVLAVSPLAAADHQVVGMSEAELPGNVARTTLTVEVDGLEVNRFQVHRVYKPQAAATRGVVVLLPPLGNPFAFFETDEDGLFQRSLVATLVHANWEVWGYTPRGYALPLGACESGAVDCSPMGGWGLAAALADVTWLRGRIAAEVPGAEPVVGGYSLGAIHALALIDEHPGDWRAAFVLDGSLYSEDPAVIAQNAGFCALLEGALAAGAVYDGQTGPLVRLVAHLAATAPDQPTPLPGFPPGTTNHQVLVFLLAVPNPSPSSPTPDFVRCVGSVPDDEFAYCDDERVTALSTVFLNYFDNRTLRDIDCALAGERTYTDELDAFDGPVLLYGGTLGFASTYGDLAPLLVNAEVTEIVFPGFGHADFWFAGNHRAYLESELLAWLGRLP